MVWNILASELFSFCLHFNMHVESKYIKNINMFLTSSREVHNGHIGRLIYNYM
jgi:hypothetical protein